MLYPNKIQKCQNKTINYSNRGMFLESLINESNQYYLEKDIALIFKKPTPIGISEAIYTERGRIIKNGYFKAPSTLDYNGIYKGKYIEFEAKETKSRTSFPLANFHEHQLKYLKRVLQHGGICFVIIAINSSNYLLKGEDLVLFIENNDRKSIPLAYLKDKAFAIPEKYNPPLDYLKIVDQVYFERN